MLCLGHILNLVGEEFSHWPTFDNVTQFITFIKSAFLKRLHLKWLEGSQPKEQVKLPSVPVVTRWNSWFNVARYHSSFGQFYKGFFKQEKSHGLAVDRILELDDQLHHTSYHNLYLNLHFINENCTCLITVLTSLEETKSLLAEVVLT